MSDDSTRQAEAATETAEEKEQQPAATPVDETAETTPETTSENGLEAELEAARAEAADYKTGWQRERAEFQNYRRRIDRERSERMQTAAAEFYSKLLPIIDDFERGLQNVPDELAEHGWVSGMTMIQKKFDTLLDNAGIEALDPVGEPFDPTQHEAVGTDDSDEVESGHVTMVLQKGYVLGDKILRPALVRVAS